MSRPVLDQATVRRLLDYDPETGEFIWCAREEVSHFVIGWNKKFAGKRAGFFKLPVPYDRLCLGNKQYYAHRVAWLYMTGTWPQFQIDHVNGKKRDNRFENLREATPSENGCNRGAERANATGYKGVYLANINGWRRYASQIQIRGKRFSLGYFDTAEEAHQAYVEAAKLHHGEFARAA